MAVNQLLTKGEYKTMSFIGKIAKLDPYYASLNFFIMTVSHAYRLE